MIVNKKPVGEMTVDKMPLNKMKFVDEMTAAKLLVDEMEQWQLIEAATHRNGNSSNVHRGGTHQMPLRGGNSSNFLHMI
jgi:hypothetical protein